MPRGVNREDEAKHQRRILGAGLNLQPNILVWRPGIFTFSSGASLATTISGKIYIIRFNYYRTGSAANVRTTIGGTIYAMRGTSLIGSFEAAIIAQASAALALESDAAVFAGLIENLSVVELIPSTATQYNYWTASPYYGLSSPVLAVSGVGATATQRTSMTSGGTYNFSADVNKVSGSEIRFSNSNTDNSNVKFTTSGLPTGYSTITFSFTTSGATFDYMVLGGSGAAFNGSISNVRITV